VGAEIIQVPKPCFDHVRRMTDLTGMWEHARILTPRHQHGYCTDDNARALIVVCREPDPAPEIVALAGTYINFLIAAALEEGGFRNRRNSAGHWTDQIGSDDSQGRALWALGTAAHLAALGGTRVAGADLFGRNAGFDSPALRANAFAILGGVEMLAAHPGHTGTLDLLHRCSARLGHEPSDDWPWLEPRLSYDNARLPEALIAAGSALGDDALVEEGLELLAWLVATETRDGHFSFTPVGGWAVGEPRPGFDQQPVEAGAMADACYRAWLLTGEQVWADRVEMAARWFMGDNDNGSRLYDPRTGGSCDGLKSSGVNHNHGAESTLSALIALQRWFQVRGR
jgi:hypothetical protein